MIEPESKNAEMDDSSPSNPCIICKYRRYVKDPALAKTFVLEGNKGIETCNKWAEWRNMNCTFQVRLFRKYYI